MASRIAKVKRIDTCHGILGKILLKTQCTGVAIAITMPPAIAHTKTSFMVSLFSGVGVPPVL
jgi:hypothetical protein